MKLKIKNNALFALTFLLTQANIVNALTQNKDCNGNHCPEINCESNDCEQKNNEQNDCEGENCEQKDCKETDCEKKAEYFAASDNSDIENCLNNGTFSGWKTSEDVSKNLVTYYAFAKKQTGVCNQYIVRYQLNKTTNSWETLPEKVIEIKK